jgi:hypothetical protein
MPTRSWLPQLAALVDERRLVGFVETRRSSQRLLGRPMTGRGRRSAASSCHRANAALGFAARSRGRLGNWSTGRAPLPIWLNIGASFTT